MAKLIRAEYSRAAYASRDPLHRDFLVERTVVEADSGNVYNHGDLFPSEERSAIEAEPDADEILRLLGLIEAQIHGNTEDQAAAESHLRALGWHASRTHTEP